MDIKENISFKELTTFKVGGFAKRVVYPKSKEEVQRLFKELKESKEEFIVLGGGSNVVASDEDFSGTVIVPLIETINFTKECVVVGSGLYWDKFVQMAVENRFWGVENLSAIPGTVGGAVFQNIGAYGSVLSDVLESVFVYNIEEDKFELLHNQDCNFNYRTSLFKEKKNKYIILEISLKLLKENSPNIEYKDLKNFFENNKNPTLSDIRDVVIYIRSNKFPNMNQYGTAGSFFLNPIVSSGDAMVFKDRFPEMPLFKIPEGGVKIPLAWLLDNVIKAKEMSVGGAFVCDKQALVIATNKNATANDIKKLAEKIKKEVKEKINLEIFFEVNFL